jgi:hypothetical protein
MSKCSSVGLAVKPTLLYTGASRVSMYLKNACITFLNLENCSKLGHRNGDPEVRTVRNRLVKFYKKNSFLGTLGLNSTEFLELVEEQNGY